VERFDVGDRPSCDRSETRPYERVPGVRAPGTPGHLEDATFAAWRDFLLPDERESLPSPRM
jgi:hypothetical protein